MSDAPETRQIDLIRERFTGAEESFGDYALDSRVSEAERFASLATAGIDAARMRPRMNDDGELEYTLQTIYVVAEKIG